ncbi:hypothetical protein GRAQ_02334 [Rahnella aquatilis CIP 78.65 = ATCC 33071]|nr:hypothetical protein GRAQ_02334 [Rahnella aquatilis CIP 78.65 = ATCC 33071]
MHRIDKKKALKNAWNNSTDNEAAFYPSSKVIPLVKELSGAQKLYSQVTPYSSSPVEAIFSLNGLSEAMKPLQKACKWQ